MAGEEERESRNYAALKEKLSSQPRSRATLERLERLKAPLAMLEAVAGKFSAGEHGEAEIQAAIYSELLRNRDQKAVLKRVAQLRTTFAKIQQDLCHIAGQLHQFKSWTSHGTFGFGDWAEFCNEVIGLSDKISEALLMAREQVFGLDLDGFLQAVIKGYVVPSPARQARPSSPEEFPEKSNPSEVIKELKERLDLAEFKIGEMIRARKKLEEELEKTRAEMYQKVQEKQAFIDKLTKNFQSAMPASSKSPSKRG
jgi:predicted RNase H-like nuclease (RuvC/YqgF family)